MGSVKNLFTLPLDEGLAKELAIVASAMHKSQREVVETALDFYFDYTDWIIADKITDEIKGCKIKVHDSEDVYKELGIEL